MDTLNKSCMNDINKKGIIYFRIIDLQQINK